MASFSYYLASLTSSQRGSYVCYPLITTLSGNLGETVSLGRTTGAGVRAGVSKVTCKERNNSSQQVFLHLLSLNYYLWWKSRNYSLGNHRLGPVVRTV